MKSLAHKILFFRKSVLNICLIKAQKASLFMEKFMKEPVLFLWLEGATFHWVVVGCKFNIMNI